MKGLIFKTTGILAITFLLGLQLMAQPPSPQDVLNQIFSAVRSKVIDGANNLQTWKDAATSAATKKATDFTDCPSPEAQNLYNDLIDKKRQAVAVYDLAHQADLDAQKARDDCKNKTHLDAACNTAYNGLSFQATANAANGTINAINTALGVLKALKCPSGCNRTARIVYPTFELGDRNVNIGVRGKDFTKVNLPPGVPVEFPLVNDITYCSVWKRGTFWANWDSGNGEFNGEFHAKLPQCEKTNTISVCTDWDLNLVLPKLQKLNFVPPSVKVSDLKVEIPNKDVTAITGVKQANCNRPIKVAKRASLTFNFELSSDPLSILSGQGGEMVEIGCADPAFGLEPITTNVSMPDLTKVRISWNGITVKGGYIEVNMTKGEFQGMCKKGYPSNLKVPTVNVGKGYLDLPNVCLEPRLVNLVATR